MTRRDKPISLGEFDIIAAYFRPLTGGRGGALDLLDDAGILTPPAGTQLVVTTDALVAGRHFLAGTAPEGLAHKALGMNLSDLAAMGAEPAAYTLAFVAPKPLSEAWLGAFTAGLADMQAEHDVFLLGGDTVSTAGPMTLSVTALGWVPAGKALRRSGARAGDDLYISGTVGDAALGLLIARDGRKLAGEAGDAFLKERYEQPRPRTRLGPRLIGVASACIDVSDGLAADVGHIAETSHLAAEVRIQDLPLSDAARVALDGDPRLLSTLVTGGDDYELAFTAPPGAADAVRTAARAAGVPVTRIGVMTEGDGVRAIGPGGAPLDLGTGGFRHF
ncbi:MAG: thiamine-phosphate kinase [Rhodospirillales bacterium CG15_BIG_FIL_POST_REV_8_21_14_020_66_15]|nr:MAG: thiamine-phosphate kinase [Rhodospirillales bacterium CG15_BIG_FIL_POST_REV_8_21_14_020_66_15]